jgi:hypothetical protein
LLGTGALGEDLEDQEIMNNVGKNNKKKGKEKIKKEII